LVAPHGGRRAPVDAANPPPNLRVNDVYTPELTRLLGERLDAGWIINERIDRNRLDLNRTSQVVRHGAWFLDLLATEIEAILVRHGHAEVLFVHGWNVGQAKCDLGIGATERQGRPELVHGARWTVSDDYRETRLAALRRSGAQHGIKMSLGERYPAGHPNNLLQLFTAHDRHAHIGPVRRLAEWSAAGVVNAMQLELGIPLRWPGPWRERFLAVLDDAFDPSQRHRLTMPDTRQPTSSEQPFAPAALQFYDPGSQVGLLAGVGPIGPGVLGGRLLVFLGGQRVALFTGEDGIAHGCVAPMEYRDEGNGQRLRFDGTMLLLDDAATYLDLEMALSASHSRPAHVDLTFRDLSIGRSGVRFGWVQGRVAVDGDARHVDCHGFANLMLLRGAGGRGGTTLAAAFPDGTAVLARQGQGRAHEEDGGGRGWRFAPEEREMGAGEMEIVVGGDGFTPVELVWRFQGAPSWRAIPQSRMAILRSTSAGYVRVAFGVARVEAEGGYGSGFYEHVAPLAPPDAVSQSFR
jgi:hypothetical protein